MSIKRSIQLLPLAMIAGLWAPDALSEEEEDQARAGKIAFNTSCRTCHSTNEGDNRLGPNLHDIIGREAGAADYNYSPAMASSDVVWDAETLDRFIEDPEAVVPGNTMRPYGGISDADVRADIVAHLKAVSDEAEEAE